MRLALLQRFEWLAIAALASAGCGQDAPPAKEGKPVIAVSIYPVASLVEQLTGDWAEVTTLLQPGVSEHEGDFTPDQVRRLDRAELLVVVGMGLDPWAEQAVEHAEQKVPVWRMSDLIGSRADVDPTGAVSADIPRDEKNSPPGAGAGPAKLQPPPEPASPNNHLWLDPVLARRFVAALAEKLAERYPAHRDAIQAATVKLDADLKRLDAEYRDHLAVVPQRELITFHNAFDLIARRYGLKIVAHLTDIESTPGGEVTPDRFLEAIKAIKNYQLNAVYAEPEFPDEALKSIRRETGVEVLELDPLGGPRQAGYETYQEMMRSNLKTLVKGQSQPTEEPETKGAGDELHRRIPVTPNSSPARGEGSSGRAPLPETTTPTGPPPSRQGHLNPD